MTGDGTLVLVVEDNSTNQLLITAILNRAGFRVRIAGNADEAMTSLTEERPDLILMDVQLPGRDGLTLTRELKANARTAAIPVVALTAHAMASDREAAFAAGCAGYLSKPIDTRTLATDLTSILATVAG